MIAVDTSVLIAWARGQGTAQTRFLAAYPAAGNVVVGDIVFAEIVQGARDDADAARLARWLSAFRRVRMTDEATALRAATMRRVMRAAGHTPRGLMDLLIGAWCVMQDVPVLAADRDFEAMERLCGLRLERGA